MLKFIVISILLMTFECAITDKLEKIQQNRADIKEDIKEDVDIETLKILSDYGLVNSGIHEYNSNNLNKV